MTFGNFLVLVAGHDKEDQREYAGVGFIIAHHIVPSIIGATCYSNMIACLKLRVPGGNACICSVYAPHNGHSLRVRQSFFAQLIRRYNSVSAHGPKLIYGDLNARIHHRLAGEDPIIGPFPFGDPLAIIGGSKNRQLLIEACKALRLTVANTWFDSSIEDQVSFYAIGASPM